MDFLPGDQIELPFFVEQINDDGTTETIDISEVSGVMYETKNPGRIVKVYKHDTEDAPTQVDAKTVLFTITSADTLKCRPGFEYSFDVWVGNIKQTFLGILGVCGDSPIKNIVHE